VVSLVLVLAWLAGAKRLASALLAQEQVQCGQLPDGPGQAPVWLVPRALAEE